MKSFASALLVAGASAAFAAIDFSATGTMKFVNMSTIYKTLKQYGSKTDSGVTITNESQAQWTIETAIATKNYKVTMATVGGFGNVPASGKTNVAELFSCYRYVVNTTAGFAGLQCHILQILGNNSDANVTIEHHVYNMKNNSDSTVITSGDLTGDSATGTRAFLFGSADNNDSKKGFADARVWTVYTKFKKAAAGLADGDVTYVDGDPVNRATAKYTGPTTTVASKGTYIGGSAGFKVTNTIIYQPADGTEFVTNGLLYSAAVQTLDQVNPSALAGIAWIKDSNAAASPAVVATDSVVESSVKNDSLTKGIVTNPAPQVDGLATDSFDFYSNSGMSKVDTLSSANSQVVAAKVGSAGQFLITVTHSAKLATAIDTTDVQVQMLTCLNTYTAAAPKQYLCFLTNMSTDGTENKESTDIIITHQLWMMDTALLDANFDLTNNLFNEANVNLNKTESKGSMMYEAVSNKVKVGAEATLNGQTKPNGKMFWPAGNYVSMDLQNLQMKMGFLGVGKAGSTDSAEAKSTIDLAKLGLASGFSGTATMLGSTKKNSKSAATVLGDKAPAACTDPTEDVCISKHPSKCSKSGALSTVATVGAAIAALAMSF